MTKLKKKLSKKNKKSFERVNNKNELVKQVCGNQTVHLVKMHSEHSCPKEPISGVNPSHVTFRDGAYNLCLESIGNYTVKEALLLEKNRLARAASPANPPIDMASFLKHNTIVSHIVNAIYLQYGLMEGKIPIDELTGELLGFGSVNAADIANFTPDKAIALISKFKEVGKILKDSFNDEVKKLEEDTLKWNEMSKEHESIGEDVKIPEKDQYLKDIAALKAKMSELNTIGPILGRYIGQLDTLYQAFASDKSMEAALDFSGFGAELSNGLTLFGEAVKTINSFETLKNGETVFQPLGSKVLLMSTRGNTTPGSNTNNKDVIKKNIEAVSGALQLSTDASKDMENIGELVGQKVASKPENKKYSDGFPNGVAGLKQVSKDVSDPWISDIIKVDASKLSKLTDGLHPLSKLSNQLGSADEKLKPISSANIHQSTMGFGQLQSMMSELSPDSVDTVEVLTGYEGCRQPAADPKDCKTAQDFLESVRLLAQRLPKLESAADKLNVDELEKEVNDVIDSLGPQDDIKTVTGKSKGNASLKSLKDRLAKVKEQFNFNDIDQFIATIEAGDGSNDQAFTSSWDRQKAVQKCLQSRQDHFGKAEKLSKALQVIQVFRAFDSNQYQDVELAASTIAQVAQHFPAIRSIQGAMKKDSKDVSKEINMLLGADQKTKIIGQSVSSLQYAFMLKDLESSLAPLKSVGPIVEAEIQKIKSDSEKKLVEDQWGDHQNHMAEWEATLAKIKEFEAIIDVSKALTIGEYGAPLEGLVIIPNAKINVQEKLKALDALISTADPKNKDALEDAKKTLEKLVPLDLDFSSHQTQFQNAPKAFGDVHDFLADFLSANDGGNGTGDASKDSLSTSDKKPEAAGTNWLIIVLSAVGGLSIFVGAVWYFWWYSPKQKAKEAERQRQLDEAKDEEDKARKAEKEAQKARDEARARERAAEEQKEQAEKREREAEEEKKQAVIAKNAEEIQKNEAMVGLRRAEQNARVLGGEIEAQNRRNAEAQRAAHDLERKQAAEAEERNRNLKGPIEKWIVAQTYDSKKRALTATRANMQMGQNANNNKVTLAASIAFLGAKNHRYPEDVPCRKDTAVHFTTKGSNPLEVKVHANFVHGRSQPKKFIATQAPEQCTFQDFWLMVLEHKTQYIVMLCQPEEKDVKYDEYFNPEVGSKNCGAITVTTTANDLVLDGMARRRTIEVVDKKYGYQPLTVTHYHHLGWPDKKIPDELEKTCKLMEMLKSNTPVVVHCSAGIGRTVTFIGLDIIMEEVENCPSLLPAQSMCTLRGFRALGVQNSLQLFWLMLAVGYRLSKKHKIDMKHFEAQYEFFKDIRLDLEGKKTTAAKNKSEDEDADRKKAGSDSEDDDEEESWPEYEDSEEYRFVSKDPRRDEECRKRLEAKRDEWLKLVKQLPREVEPGEEVEPSEEEPQEPSLEELKHLYQEAINIAIANIVIPAAGPDDEEIRRLLEVIAQLQRELAALQPEERPEGEQVVDPQRQQEEGGGGAGPEELQQNGLAEGGANNNPPGQVARQGAPGDRPVAVVMERNGMPDQE